MKKEITFEVELGQHGLPFLPPVENARLRATPHEKDVHLKGNREGFRLLARALLALTEVADEELAKGYHVHLDDELYHLSDDGTGLLLVLDP